MAVYITAAVGCLSDFDVTISGVEMPVTVFSKNNPSEGFYYPNTAAHLNTDGLVIADYYVSGVPIDDFINVKIENGEEGDEVEVTLLLDE